MADEVTISSSSTLSSDNTVGKAANTVTITQTPITCVITGSGTGNYGMMASAHIRSYKNSTTTFSIANGTITQIVITTTSASDYPASNFTADTGTYTTSSATGTWTGSASSVTFSASAQVRWSSAVITYTTGSSDKSTPTISWAVETDTVTTDDMASYTLPTLTIEPNTLEYTLSSSNEDVAYYDTDDEVFSVLKAGTTTITAKTTETDEYNSASASFKLVVIDTKATTLSFKNSSSSMQVGGKATNYPILLDAYGKEITDAEVTVTLADESIATYSDKVFYGHAVGSTTATATYAGDDNHNAATATATIKVYRTKYYQRVTSIEDGEKYLIGAVTNDTALVMYISGTYTSGYAYPTRSYTKITNDLISSTYDNEWTFTKTDNGYTINDQSGRYIYHSGKYNNYNYNTDLSTAASKGTPYFNVTPNDDGTFTIADVDSAYIMQYTSYKNYGQYATVTGLLPCLWKELDYVDVDVTEVGYATLYYGDKALLVPTNIKATTYSVTDGSLTEGVTYSAKSVIPAGEAVVLSGTNTTAATYRFYVTTTDAEKDANNQLLGSDEDAQTVSADGETDGYKFYMLSTKDGEDVGFYWGADEGAAFTNAAHRAYLPVKQTAAAKFYLLNGQTTGIATVETSESVEDGKIYDLSGRQITNHNVVSTSRTVKNMLLNN